MQYINMDKELEPLKKLKFQFEDNLHLHIYNSANLSKDSFNLQFVLYTLFLQGGKGARTKTKR